MSSTAARESMIENWGLVVAALAVAAAAGTQVMVIVVVVVDLVVVDVAADQVSFVSSSWVLMLLRKMGDSSSLWMDSSGIGFVSSFVSAKACHSRAGQPSCVSGFAVVVISCTWIDRDSSKAVRAPLALTVPFLHHQYHWFPKKETHDPSQ